MEEIFFKYVSSLSWWFGVVFVGVLVSLGASYLKPRIDKWIAKFSETRRKKNEIEAEQWQKEVNEIREDESLKIIKLAELSHLHGWAAFIMLAGVSLFLMGNSFSYVFQIPEFMEPEKASKFTSAIEPLKEFGILIILQLISYIMGAISFLLGVLYFKNAERVYRQINAAGKKV